MYKRIEALSCNKCCNGKAIIILSVCLYPACNAYAQYRPLYSARLHNICPLYLINGMIFVKKVTEREMNVLNFLAWNISHSKKQWARYDQKCVFVLNLKNLVSFLMKIEFSRQIFEKYTNIRFHENLFNGNTVALFVRTYWRTDRQTDMPKLFVAVRNFAIRPNNWCLKPNYFQIKRIPFMRFDFKNRQSQTYGSTCIYIIFMFGREGEIPH